MGSDKLHPQRNGRPNGGTEFLDDTEYLVKALGKEYRAAHGEVYDDALTEAERMGHAQCYDDHVVFIVIIVEEGPEILHLSHCLCDKCVVCLAAALQDAGRTAGVLQYRNILGQNLDIGFACVVGNDAFPRIELIPAIFLLKCGAEHSLFDALSVVLESLGYRIGTVGVGYDHLRGAVFNSTADLICGGAGVGVYHYDAGLEAGMCQCHELKSV